MEDKYVGIRVLTFTHSSSVPLGILTHPKKNRRSKKTQQTNSQLFPFEGKNSLKFALVQQDYKLKVSRVAVYTNLEVKSISVNAFSYLPTLLNN
jgi:hypothetical protein